MEAEDEASKEHLAAREVARGHEAEVKAAHSGKQKLAKVNYQHNKLADTFDVSRRASL